MQQSGGLLLAAGLDGGNTIIFIPSGMKMLTNLASSSASPDGGYTIIPLPG